jgi:hypothetical protein
VVSTFKRLTEKLKIEKRNEEIHSRKLVSILISLSPRNAIEVLGGLAQDAACFEAFRTPIFHATQLWSYPPSA